MTHRTIWKERTRGALTRLLEWLEMEGNDTIIAREVVMLFRSTMGHLPTQTMEAFGESLIATNRHYVGVCGNIKCNHRLDNTRKAYCTKCRKAFKKIHRAITKAERD